MKSVNKTAKVSSTFVKKEMTPKNTSNASFVAIIANVIGGILACVFIMAFFNHTEQNQQTSAEDIPWNSGYDWLLNTMLKSNLETIEKNPNLTTQQRYEAKWGGEIGYINKVKNATKESDIILFPPQKLMLDAGLKSAYELPWLSYFLYPRKLCYEGDSLTAEWKNKANYLVSVNNWGLDKLNYQVEKPEGFMILPIKK